MGTGVGGEEAGVRGRGGEGAAHASLLPFVYLLVTMFSSESPVPPSLFICKPACVGVCVCVCVCVQPCI